MGKKPRDSSRKSATRRLRRQAGENFDYNKSERFITAVKVIVCLAVLYFAGKWVYDNREHLVTEPKPVVQGPAPSEEKAKQDYAALRDVYDEIVGFDADIRVIDRTMNQHRIEHGDRSTWNSKVNDEYFELASQKSLLSNQRKALVEKYNSNSKRAHDSVLSAGDEPLPREVEP